MTQLTTAVLWFITHLTLSLRNNVSSDFLEDEFEAIKSKLDCTADEATVFLLKLIEKLSHNSYTLVYKSETTIDSLEPLDALVMNNNEVLKQNRRTWELEFSKIADEVKNDQNLWKGQPLLNQSSCYGKW